MLIKELAFAHSNSIGHVSICWVFVPLVYAFDSDICTCLCVYLELKNRLYYSCNQLDAKQRLLGSKISSKFHEFSKAFTFGFTS